MCARACFKTKEEKKAYRERIITQINDLLTYATKTYNCKFPSNFDKKLYNVAYQKWVPTRKVIDAIYAEWKLWKPYISEESYEKFMQTEIYGMFKIQTTSTFFVPDLKGYIGNKAVVIKEIPSKMITTIYSTGRLTLNLKQVEVPFLVKK